MKKNMLATLVMAFLLFPGCMMERGYENSTPENLAMTGGGYYGFVSNSADNFVDIIGSRLSGNVGTVGGLGNAPSYVRGFDEGGYTETEVGAITTDGSAMVLLTFVGGINHSELEPGYVHQFSGESRARAQADGDLYVGAIVCSGKIPGEWTYDDISSRTEVQVEDIEPSDENPEGGKRINFSVTTSAEDFAVGHLDVLVSDVDEESL